PAPSCCAVIFLAGLMRPTHGVPLSRRWSDGITLRLFRGASRRRTDLIPLALQPPRCDARTDAFGRIAALRSRSAPKLPLSGLLTHGLNDDWIGPVAIDLLQTV